MTQSAAKRVFSGSIWGVLAKILDAAAKFITIPLLVGYYGRADYGLVALAFSLNAYLRLMDLGFNIGAVRYFAKWVTEGNMDKIGRVSRSSIVFYGVIGLLNALIFIVMGHHGQWFFTLTAEQEPVYRTMMYILAASTIFNWLSNVLVQLLSAKDELGFVNRITIISSILNFATAFAAITLHWSLPLYFLAYTLSTLIVIPFYTLRLRVFNVRLAFLLLPKWDGPAFREILNYSLAIFVMGLFQLTANHLRPLLLGRYANDISVLTDYRVIQTIAMLIVAFAGVFMQVLLPSASKLYAEQNQQRLESMVYNGTKYITVFLSFMVFILVVNASNILTLYMGDGYEALSLWMALWLVTVLLYAHNTPVASLVLSTGKTKFLVYSSATSCILSLPVTALLAPQYGVGAAVIGYFFYIVLQIAFYYVYYIPKVLKLDSSRIFMGSFLPATAGGVLAAGVTYFAAPYLKITDSFAALIVHSLIFSVLFGLYIVLFVMRPKEISELKNKLISKKANKPQQ